MFLRWIFSNIYQNIWALISPSPINYYYNEFSLVKRERRRAISKVVTSASACKNKSKHHMLLVVCLYNGKKKLKQGYETWAGKLFLLLGSWNMDCSTTSPSLVYTTQLTYYIVYIYISKIERVDRGF